jgi:polygalacturonase
MLLLTLFSCSKADLTANPAEGEDIDNPPTYTPENVKAYPAPAGADLSQKFEVKVEGLSVPVYNLKVAPANEANRWAAMDDKINSHTYYENAAFAYFDRKNTVEVAITVPNSILSVKILPTSAAIAHTISGKTIKIKVAKAERLTIEINGNWTSSLHLFANDFETDIPDPNDPNVIYYGPGIHQISKRQITSPNQTIYIAGGAIVKAVIDPAESYTTTQLGLRKYSPTFALTGSNIKVRGRGILDASECTNQSRELIYTTGENASIEGIIIKDPPVWTMPIMNTKNVTVDNVKILGYRANSDGIDICNSTDVTIKNCFIRTLDDLVTIKTLAYGVGNKSERIVVENCILWNEVAHSLVVGAEITEDINDVTFRNCDIIHDKGREWSLRVYHTDKAKVNNVKYENIRIEESKKLISLWIGYSSNWSSDLGRGYINNVTFSNIDAKGNPSTIDLTGYDATHKIESVTFNNVVVNGSPIQPSQVNKNAYVSGVTITP